MIKFKKIFLKKERRFDLVSIQDLVVNSHLCKTSTPSKLEERDMLSYLYDVIIEPFKRTLSLKNSRYKKCCNDQTECYYFMNRLYSVFQYKIV